MNSDKSISNKYGSTPELSSSSNSNNVKFEELEIKSPPLPPPIQEVVIVKSYESDAGRTIGPLYLAGISFFTVCGGPFGIEVAVGAAGPLYTFISFFILPFIWAIPQCLMMIELSSMMSGNGGFVIWVRDAFGEISAWIAGMNGLVSGILDLGLYPAIFASYMAVLVPSLSWFELYMIKLAVCFFGFLLNYRGLSWVSLLSMFLTVSIFLPFFVELGWKFDVIRAGGDSWLQTPSSEHKARWGVFFSTILWSYTGWDRIGATAGEVKNPARTYPIGISLSLLLVTFMYCIPLLIAVQAKPDWWNYDDGTYGDVAFDFAHWIGIWITFASLLSNLGLFLVSLTNSARVLWAMADDSTSEPIDSHTGVFRVLPKWVAYNSTLFGTPVASLFIHLILCPIIVLADFELLVQSEMILAAINLLFEFAVFLWLRYKQPNRTRGFKVPGGWFGVWLITIPKVCVLLFLLITTDLNSWIIGGGINVIIIIWYFIRTYKRQTNYSVIEDDETIS